MKKIVKISIFIAVLALIGLLVFLGYKYYFSEQSFRFSDFSKEKIAQSINGDYKTFSIKRIGLEFETPNDWISTTENGPLRFKDKDTDVEFFLEHFREWTQGCAIDVSLEEDDDSYGSSTFDRELERKEFARNGEDEFCLYDYCGIETINDKEFLKYVFEAKDDELGIIFQMVTFTYFNEEKKEILRVSGYLSSQVPKCKEYLNHFVNTLKFN